MKVDLNLLFEGKNYGITKVVVGYYRLWSKDSSGVEWIGVLGDANAAGDFMITYGLTVEDIKSNLGEGCSCTDD